MRATTLFGRGDVGALSTFDDVPGELGVEVWVLGVSFHVAAHARVAIKLQHQRGEDMNADGTRFLGGCCIDAIHERHVESASDGEPFGKDGCPREHGAVGSLFVLEERDFEAGLGERDLLEFVEVVHLPCEVAVSKSVGEREETRAWADFAGECAGSEFSCAVSLLVGRLTQLVNIAAGKVELADLFLQRHAPHEIVDTDFNGLCRIQVEGFHILGLRLSSSHSCGEQRDEDHLGSRFSSHDPFFPLPTAIPLTGIAPVKFKDS